MDIDPDQSNLSLGKGAKSIVGSGKGIVVAGKGTGKVTGKGTKKTAKKNVTSYFRRKKKRQETFGLYIYKVLKQIHDETGVSKRAMSIMNSFINDLFDRLVNEAVKLVLMNKKRTLSSKEVRTAARLILPGELYKHATNEANKAVTKYQTKPSHI